MPEFLVSWRMYVCMYFIFRCSNLRLHSEWHWDEFITIMKLLVRSTWDEMKLSPRFELVNCLALFWMFDTRWPAETKIVLWTVFTMFLPSVSFPFRASVLRHVCPFSLHGPCSFGWGDFRGLFALLCCAFFVFQKIPVCFFVVFPVYSCSFLLLFKCPL